MDYHAGLLAGIAELLGDAGIGVYRATGVYKPDERGIVVSVMPEDPTEVMSVSIYDPTFTALSPSARADLAQTGIQIRWRTVGNPLIGYELFDRMRALLDRKRLELGDTVARGRLKSFGYVGTDSNQRHLFTSNWVLSGFAPRP